MAPAGWDPHGNVSLSTFVVHEVAEREGVDPLDLDQRLSDVVDPEALDRLFEPRADGNSDRGLEITFRFCGYRIVVRSPDEIRISRDPDGAD
jgi:hypothetical protein